MRPWPGGVLSDGLKLPWRPRTDQSQGGPWLAPAADGSGVHGQGSDGMDFLLVTMGSAGDVHPFIGLGGALQARGHRVAILTYPAYADLAQSADLEYLYLPRPAGQKRPRAGAGRLFGPLARFFDRRWRKLARRSSVLPLMRSVYEGVARHAVPGRTVVVAHHTALGARIAHDRLGTPLVSVQMSAAAFRSAWSPPATPPLWLYPGTSPVVRPHGLPAARPARPRSAAGRPGKRLPARTRGAAGAPPVRGLELFSPACDRAVSGLVRAAPTGLAAPDPRLAGFPLFDRGGMDAP